MMNLKEKKTAAQWKKIFDSETFEQEWCYGQHDLGANYGEKGTQFKIWVPTADHAALNLYKTGNENELPFQIYPMNSVDHGIYEIYVPGNLDGVYYTYTIHANAQVKEICDIYGRACGANGLRSMVVDLKSTDPMGWEKDVYRQKNDQPVIIYELHIKDFSNDPHSGIREDLRGKYLAFTLNHTSLNQEGRFETGIDYLKSLGVTHVHLLPSYDYGSIDELHAQKEDFNWGYDPVNYNVPEGSYATNAKDGKVRINEFKRMVMALHQAGIKVVMDVVYNHTYDIESPFSGMVPYYYYREDEDGTFSNGSLCGNDTASDRKMYRAFMIDSVCYWAQEYHIDGFRFDLMGLHDVQTMNDIRQALNELPDGENIIMYGEPWMAGNTSMKEGSVPAIKNNIHYLDQNIAIFNDDTRDSIKGSVFFEDEGGYVNGHPEYADKIRSSVLGWCDGKGGYMPKHPGQCISYVSAHDNFTLWDKLVYTKGDSVHFDVMSKDLLQRNKFAAGITFTCLGHVFMQAGEEFARTKQGIGDSYNKPASLNQLDWNRAAENKDLVDYYKHLIQLRKSFGVFTDYDSESCTCVEFHKQENKNIVSFTINGTQNEQTWEKLFVIYNPEESEVNVQIPEGQWQMISDGAEFFENSSLFVEDHCLYVKPLGVTIFGMKITK